MSRKCRHPRACRAVLRVHGLDGPMYRCNVCTQCGHWLPLGASNDASEAVQVEIRAAELAARCLTALAGCENCGWLAWRDDLVHMPNERDTPSEFHAAWLAAVIHDHATAGEG